MAKRVEYTSADVVQFAMQQQGIEVDIETINQWVDGDAYPPSDYIPAFEAIIRNLPFHLRGFQASKLFDPQSGKDSFTKTVQTPKHKRVRAQNKGEADIYGMQRLNIGELYFSKPVHDALTSIARVCKLSRTGLIQQLTQNAVQMVIDASQVDLDQNQTGFNQATQTFMATQKKRRATMDPSTRVVRFTKEVKKRVDND
jgi:hypothetical protein